jgi:hypothetical protein
MVTALHRDPTRTLSLRVKFQLEADKRMDVLEKAIRNFVDTEDAFALKPTNDGGLQQILAENARDFQFQSDAEKLRSFKKWFDEQVKKGVLTVEDEISSDAWTANYVKSAYRMAHVRAYTEVKQRKASGKVLDMGREDFLNEAFNSAVAISKMELLATQTYDQLKGITAAMDQTISRVLAEALAHGRSAKQITKLLNEEVIGLGRKRSAMLAHTEIVRAHAEGQLDALQRMGVQRVGVMVEWVVGGNPCKICADRAGGVYTIDEARGLIPYHTFCKCAWIPYLEGI